MDQYMRWYISVAAAREYARIAALPCDTDDDLHRATVRLAAVCERAHWVRDVPEYRHTLYRASAPIACGTGQVDLYVSTTPRPEGDLLPLVRVRLKRGPRRRSRKDAPCPPTIPTGSAP